MEKIFDTFKNRDNNISLIRIGKYTGFNDKTINLVTTEPIENSKPEVAVSESVSEPESVLEPETETPEVKEEVSEFKAPENVIQPQNEPATTPEFSEQTASTPQEVSRKENSSQDI